MYLNEAYEVLEGWEEFPPPFLLLRRLVPWEKSERRQATVEDCMEVAALFARRN